MKRLLSLLAALALLAACAGAAFAEPGTEKAAGVVVKNYKELLAAINDKHAERVLISAKYKHGTTDVTNLTPVAGSAVTILPENGESAVINGRVDIYGNCTVNFENVSIAGPAGDLGLWIGYGANVTIGSVTGGKAKKDSGFPAVVVDRDATLTIDSAVGSDGKAGFGGDGIYAFSNSTITAREAIGGSAPKGFGGSGIVAFDNTKVTVTGSAAGGSGLYAGGKGVLLGSGSSLEGDGTLTDGTELEGKKTLDPEDITNQTLLEYALRSGKTEILLSSGFKATEGFRNDLCLFVPSEETIRIANASDEKPATVNFCLQFAIGTWSLENLRFSLNSKDWTCCIWAAGTADVTASGSMNTKGSACGLYANGNGKIEYTGDCSTENMAVFLRDNASIVFNGNITETGKKHFAAGVEASSGVARINGDITVTNDSNALACFDGKIEMTGSIHTKNTKAYPAIFSSGGEAIVNGPIESNGQAEAIYSTGGSVTVNGDVYGASKKLSAVTLKSSNSKVVINGTLTTVTTAVRAEGGSAVINGDVIVRAKKSLKLTETKESGTITVTGETRQENP